MRHIFLTKSENFEKVSTVIWSETSVPYIIDDNGELLAELQKAVPQNGFLITGGLRAEGDVYGRISKVWNSIFTFNKNGIFDVYDKHHLVPFGEYIPLQKFLPFVEKITEGAMGFSEGPGPKTVNLNNFSFSPLLCYEVIFSGEAVNKKSQPDLMINLTNDAWFGDSSGPYQHLNMARMRAIEYGISLARIAGTGISAYVDPFGRVVKQLKLNEEGILDVSLIRNSKKSLYAKYQQLGLLLLTSFLIFLLFFSKFLPKNFSKK